MSSPGFLIINSQGPLSRLLPVTGLWEDVTPSGMTMDPNGTPAGTGNNFGVQGVYATPSGVLLAPATYQGIWRSDNFGSSWSKITIVGDDPITNGRPFFTMAPDGSYILTRALYPINGYSNGCWKSTDTGVTWELFPVGAPNGDDMGTFAILGSDVNRVVGMSHSDPFHMFESRDAGETWTDQGSTADAGESDIFWIDANTLLAIGQGDDGAGNGSYRGVRSGSTWPWTWNWTSVSTQQHWHGFSQVYIDPASGVIYAGGAFGIQRSTDDGENWTTVSSTFSAGIVGTDNYLYSSTNYASSGGFAPHLMWANRLFGEPWNDFTSVPAGLNNGWPWASAVYTGYQWVIVSGNWNAGVWRLVEYL